MVSKFVAKFRKENDYSDDYSYSSKKKNAKRHDPVKRMMKQNYDELLQDFGDDYQPVRKKFKRMY
jgi:hypothetical protein